MKKQNAWLSLGTFFQVVALSKKESEKNDFMNTQVFMFLYGCALLCGFSYAAYSIFKYINEEENGKARKKAKKKAKKEKKRLKALAAA